MSPAARLATRAVRVEREPVQEWRLRRRITEGSSDFDPPSDAYRNTVVAPKLPVAGPSCENLFASRNTSSREIMEELDTECHRLRSKSHDSYIYKLGVIDMIDGRSRITGGGELDGVVQGLLRGNIVDDT